MSAQRKHKQKSVQVVRSISKFAGTLAGTTVGIGKKAPGLKAFVEVKALAAVLESELDAANHELATLESELAVANCKLDKIWEKTKKKQSQLSSQLKAFQAESESLNSALKQAKNKTRGAKIKATRMSERVAILETEVNTANHKLVLTQEKFKKTQSQLVSQIKDLQAKNESLNSVLKQARNKTRGAKNKATRMSERVAVLETTVATTNGKIAETQEKTKKTQSQLVSQIKDLQAKNEFLNSALKQTKNKTRGIKARETRTSGCAAALETELVTANRKLAELQERGKETQSQLKALQTENKSLNSTLKQAQNKASGMRALQTENESLNSELKQSKNKTRGAKIKTTRTSEHVATLKSELDTTSRKLAKLQEKAKKEQSELLSQLAVLQEENKSAGVVEKIDAVKAEADQLIQQIDDSCSQTQHDTIETTKQQNKKQAELS